jgi:hypothetical protein
MNEVGLLIIPSFTVFYAGASNNAQQYLGKFEVKLESA